MIAAFLFSLLTSRPSHWRFSYCWLRLLELELLRASHHRCNVNKRQSRLSRRKNSKLIGKKPPNLVETEQENQSRKDLIVIQSSKTNLCGQWYVKL